MNTGVEGLIDKTVVSVIGLGYVGLPTALFASSSGLKVFGFDTNVDRIKKINNLENVIEEAPIQNLLRKEITLKRFIASSTLEPADYFVICVPTPIKKECADLSAVFAAARKISGLIKSGNTVILESTVPVGTTALLAKDIQKWSGLEVGKEFHVAHSPERILPGNIAEELIYNDRVIGGVTPECSRKAEKFYKYFVQSIFKIVDSKTAEMVKLVENSSRDVQIAFANQVSMLCHEAKINSHQVIQLANMHPRVNILTPGPGVGGHCIAVDPFFLIESFPKSAPLLRAARNLNDSRPEQVVSQVTEICINFSKNNGRIARVALLGLAYKPDVADFRGSPALKIAKSLSSKPGECQLIVCEPFAKGTAIENDEFQIADSWEDAVFGADVVLILVPHKDFKVISEEMLSGKLVIDPTGMLHKVGVEGFKPSKAIKMRKSPTFYSSTV